MNNAILGVIVTVLLAVVTLSVFAFVNPKFYDIIPFWIAPLASIVSFAIAVGLYFSKHRNKKWAGWVLYGSLFVYIVSISCIKN